MRPRLAALVFALLALALSGCSNRERTNLFDPGNPVSRGRPIGFAAVAMNRTVELRWQPVSALELAGYQIYRRTARESTFTELTDVLPTFTDGYFDVGVQNGVDHHYRIHYVLSNGAMSLPAEAVATPGSQIPWVSDLSAGQLIQLSPDARNVVFRSERFEGPACLDYHPDTGTLWFSDTFGERVGIRSPIAGRVQFIDDFDRPTALAVNPRDNTAWIADEGRNLVYHYRASGDLAAPPFLPVFELPIAVAVDPNDGAVYVCESAGGRVQGFSSNGALRWSTDFHRPSRVAVDSLSREVWVTSLTQGIAVRFDPAGTPLDTLTALEGPIGITVDARRGLVWVADAAGDAVAVFDRLGTPVFRRGGLSEAREIAIDPRTGDGWVTLPGGGAVVRISSSGTELGRVGGLLQPYDIIVQPGN